MPFKDLQTQMPGLKQTRPNNKSILILRKYIYLYFPLGKRLFLEVYPFKLSKN